MFFILFSRKQNQIDVFFEIVNVFNFNFVSETDIKILKNQPEKIRYSENEQNCCRGRWYLRLKHGELLRKT